MAAESNQQLLDEVNQARSWFHARKVKPIGARCLSRDETLPTREGVAQARAGDYLCRGPAGEIWPQAAANLEAKYSATDTVDSEGWRQYLPRPDAAGVMATAVPHPFRILTQWGPMTGKAGDHLLIAYRDRDAAYPEDIWVVDAQLFRATYAAVLA